MRNKVNELLAGLFLSALAAAFILSGLAWLGYVGPLGEQRAAKHAASMARSEETKVLMPGEHAHMRYTSFIALDDAAWDAMIEGLIAKDEIGISQLILTSRIMSINTNTEVLILNNGLTAVKIRVLEGKSSGISGWTQRENVK